MLPTILTAVAIVAAVLAGLAALIVVLWRAESPLIFRPLIWLQKHAMNPIQMRTAGTPGAYAGIVRHHGRVSGRAYETPVGVVATNDGFLITLPYGTQTSWLRNVLAAGEAELVTEGATYTVDQPELIPMRDVIERFSAADQRLTRVLAIDSCLRLRRVDTASPFERGVALPAA
jgi:deazaflavin-dependent oxidoreductase (nitroreductase family)